MRRAVPLLLLLLVVGVGVGGYLYARRPSPADGTEGGPHIARPVVRNNEPGTQRETVRIPPTGDPVEETLKKLFATAVEGQGPSAFPKGTRLLRLKVENGIAVLDLSAEFRGVNTMGDTGESLAQQALRDTLAQFPRIEKMRVLVEGQPFEGEHGGPWGDVPVHDNNAQAGGGP